jgi:hypothetical protein
MRIDRYALDITKKGSSPYLKKSNIIPLCNLLTLKGMIRDMYYPRDENNFLQLMASIEIYYKMLEGKSNKLNGVYVARNKVSENRWYNRIRYSYLFNDFNNGRKSCYSAINSNLKIGAANGCLYEKSPNSDVKILAMIIIKAEWIQDFVFRMYTCQQINPDSYGLIVDKNFVSTKYHYKGLRAKFKKEILPEFEGRVIETDSIIDLLCEKVELPDFLLKEEKDGWDKMISEEFSKGIINEAQLV